MSKPPSQGPGRSPGRRTFELRLYHPDGVVNPRPASPTNPRSSKPTVFDFGPTWAELEAELAALYAPPLKAKATWFKIRKALRDFASVCPTPAHQDPLTVAAAVRLWAQRCSSNNSVNSYIRALKTICGYVFERNYAKTCPFRARTYFLPKQPSKTSSLSQSQVNSLLKAALENWKSTLSNRQNGHPLGPNQTAPEKLPGQKSPLSGSLGPQSFTAGRLCVLIHILAYTGCRAREALTLTVNEARPDLGVLLLHPKAGLEFKTEASAQPLPCPPPLADVLKSWQSHIKGEWLLPCKTKDRPWLSGSPGSKPLDAVKTHGRSVGIPNLTMLAFRHTWATHAEGWGFGPAQIQRVLRHTNLQTQNHYRHADIEQLRQWNEKITWNSNA